MNKESFSTQKIREWRLPFSKKVTEVIRSFALTEKVIFYFFATLFCISSLVMLWQVNSAFLIDVPAYGGKLTEGVVGTPRFINPLLALSDSDRDLSTLIYSGLLRADSNGKLIPDLAESYTISDDKLTYTFILKKTVVFQDNTPVTADDVVFTIEKAKDPAFGSPRKSAWDSVIVKKIDDRTISLTLREPYAPFIQNTTLGILPKHIWSKVSPEEFPFSQFNTKPVGSGPYTVESISYNSSGLPSEYHLSAFKKYALGKPYISTLVIKSYSSETDLLDSFKNGDIESISGVTPGNIPTLQKNSQTVVKAPLPRVFGIFFNQNVAPALVYNEARLALSLATDRKEIVDVVLDSYGQTITGPIPPKTVATHSEQEQNITERISSAQALLEKNGWKKNDDGIYQKKEKKGTVTLSLSISTGDAPELKTAAETIQKQWQKIGALVSVKIFEVSDLNQNIIRPRKYDALLFGEVVGRDHDLYPFWHSSERNDPGLNIALYTNLKVDKVLESLRKTSDPVEKDTLLKTFNTEIQKDTPAVFLYSPYFIYIVPQKVHNITLGELNSVSERFSNVHEWYIEKDSVWKIFTKKN